MKKLFLLFFFINIFVFAQEKDTIQLKEIILLKQIGQETSNSTKINSSVDGKLQESRKINLIKRGAYAWEPVLNNMLSERSVITIDGVRIFGACTDKMDPVTSYIEMNNLSDINIFSGQEGAHYGATIAGSIDLVRRKSNFSEKGHWQGSLQSIIESNNLQRHWQGNISHSSKSLTTDISVSYRKANNYSDGRGNEIKYSQFEKLNLGVNIGVKLNSNSILRGDVIFDRANNVGYPALPMDVSLAQGVINTLTYKYNFYKSIIKHWETKLYYNSIKHFMDDTFRAAEDKLPIHMDMPGFSDTYGGISEIHLSKDKFSSDIRFNTYYNRSIAEMIMYYRSGGKMFTYTWPEVGTQYASISFNNRWKIALNQQLQFSINLSTQTNEVESDTGYNLNQVFHQFDRKIHRFMPAIQASYKVKISDWIFSIGSGFGHRAPSVSEAYGFYLFNNSDGYDYIGNPNLKNEISYESNFSTKYDSEKWKLNAQISYFHINNYIFGIPFGEITWQMTPLGSQKRGLKEYQSLPFARQLNASAEFQYKFSENWNWRISAGYSYGEDAEGRNLPFIRPLNYLSVISFEKNHFFAEISVEGDFKQLKYSQIYGEIPTPAYTIVNFLTSYRIPIGTQPLQMELGIENVLNRYYTTYADWKNLPRMGRNIRFGVKYIF